MDIIISLLGKSDVMSKNIHYLINNNLVSNIQDEFVLSFIDIYCMINNIVLNNEEKDIIGEEDNYSYLLNDLRSLPELTEDERTKLLIKAKSGDEEAKNTFIEYNIRLVISVAKKYHSYRYDLMDLIQDGSMGLMEAFDKYDIKKGYSFSTYAICWIRQKMIMALINNNNTIRIPSHTSNSLRKIEKIKEESSKNLSDEELAKLANLNVETIKRLNKVPRLLDSIDRQIGEDEGYNVGDQIASEENLEENVIKKINIEKIDEILLECLNDSFINEMEYQILHYRLGFYGEVKTFKIIGEIYNLTKQRVEQIYKKTLKRIKKSSYGTILAECYGVEKPKVKNKKRWGNNADS